MKLIFICAFVFFSITALAKDCQRTVLDAYSEHNEIHGYKTQEISKNALSVESFKSKWTEFEASDYKNPNFLVFKGLSLKQNVVGVDAIVIDRESCEIVEVSEVYVE